MFKNFRIETQRLLLRRFTMHDVPTSHQFLSDPEVTKYLPLDPMPLEKVSEMFQQRIQSYEIESLKELDRGSVAVCLKEGGELVGWCGLGRMEIAPSEIEVYYGLGRPYWGKGFATEAAAAMVDYGFREWNLDRIVAIVLPDNTASIKVLEKIGMRYEKQVTGLPEEHRFFEGVVFFALGREEYVSR
jgi:ribosomal-protein-alanine N-acetyltransferase